MSRTTVDVVGGSLRAVLAEGLAKAGIHMADDAMAAEVILALRRLGFVVVPEAIEAEARAALLAEVRAGVEGMPHGLPYRPGTVSRADVLAILDRLAVDRQEGET